jgi:hypothetical protein
LDAALASLGEGLSAKQSDSLADALTNMKATLSSELDTHMHAQYNAVFASPPGTTTSLNFVGLTTNTQTSHGSRNVPENVTSEPWDEQHDLKKILLTAVETKVEKASIELEGRIDRKLDKRVGSAVDRLRKSDGKAFCISMVQL